MRNNIAFISDNSSPLTTVEGVDAVGQNVYVAELAKALAALGHRVDIYTRSENPALPKVVDWLPGIRVIHLTAGPVAPIAREEMLSHMPLFLEEMTGFILRQQLQYDILHAHFFMSAWVAMHVKAMLGIPFTVTFHALGRVRRQYQGNTDEFPDERIRIEGEAARSADAVIAESPQDRLDLIEQYGADPASISVIPCGFSPEEFSPVAKDEAREMLDIAPHERIMLHLGRMAPRKGVDNVLRALVLAQEQVAHLRLLVVGGTGENAASCPECQRLQQFAYELGVDKRVTFVGHQPREILKYFYAAADVFVSTPWYEAFGITPLEAMACARPVIGSAVGGIKYSVLDGVTGYLVNPEDPQTLADRLAWMFNDTALLTQMGGLALKRVNRYFTWEKVAWQVDALYRRTISEHRHSIATMRALRRATLPEEFAFPPAAMLPGSVKKLHKAERQMGK